MAEGAPLFLLFLLFLGLKLANVITWSWWWVTAPLWGGAALAVVLAVLGLGVAKVGSFAFRRWLK